MKLITERFWEKVDKSGEDDCWNWIAAASGSGYGYFSVGNKVFAAHVISYGLIHGNSNPENLYVLHSCDNKACVNPKHLHLGTHTDNMHEKAIRGRQGMTSHLCPEVVIAIRKAYANGETQPIIANRYEISQSSVSRIVTREVWGHVL